MWHSRWECYIVSITIAVKKGFSNLRITSCENVPIDASYDLSFEKLVQWADVSISLPQLQIGLSQSWKLCLNLCSRRWLKPNLNIVNNLTPLELWQWKTVVPEGRMKFKSLFLKTFKLSELQIFIGPVCSIRLLEKEKKNFTRNYALLWIEEYY